MFHMKKEAKKLNYLPVNILNFHNSCNSPSKFQ